MERQSSDFRSSRFPSPYSNDDFSLLEKEVARLQGEITRDIAVAVWRGIRKTASAIGGMFVLLSKAGAASRLYDELNRLDDVTLASLGIGRGDIPQYVAASMGEGFVRRPAAAPAGLDAVEVESMDAAVADNDQPQRRAA